MRRLSRIVPGPGTATLALLFLSSGALAQAPPPGSAGGGTGWADDPPELSSIVEFARTESEMRLVMDRYGSDRAAITRRYPVDFSPVRHARLRAFYQGWQDRLAELDFEGLSQEGRIDYVLVRNRIRFDQAMLELDEVRWREVVSLVPFSDPLRELQETRHDRVRVDPRQVAETLNRTADEVERLTREVAEGTAGMGNGMEGAGGGTAGRAGGTAGAPGGTAGAAGGTAGAPGGTADGNGARDWESLTPAAASRAASYVGHLRSTVSDFNDFYAGYDPLYTWWVAGPHERLDQALDAYAAAIRRHLVGIRPGETPPIVGDPVLEDGLRAYLDVEMIPYTPEELIEIGWAEFEWIEAAFRRVSNDMGFGDDWQAALEHVKTLAPPPGEKPWAIFEIAEYSEDFVAQMDAVTVPPLAAEVWRLAMQTPERQLVNPFFTGGEVTRVSYPTDGMAHEDKLMSMRGNTPSFNFATVHHELIPGHHLQSFSTSRFNSHRPGTPFWGEGWALYWELLLWDNDFPRSNEDRIGMLFWRMHRAARIVFSMSFQLGQWTPQECIDFLVERVGHEPANAEAEVRRTAQASPLYQIAYLIGGLQFYSLYREVVDTGRMTAREYHDAVLQGGRMPVEMVRARIADTPLVPDYEAQWRFYEPPAVGSGGDGP